MKPTPEHSCVTKQFNNGTAYNKSQEVAKDGILT